MSAVAVVAVLGAKGAPGATTSAVALALGWPRSVLLVDADPGGGDIAPGWLGGRIGLERGLLSFAAATRHTDASTVAELSPHVAGVPDAPRVMVLPGLAHAGQTGGLDTRVWTRLLTAATSPWPASQPAAEQPESEQAAGQPGAERPAAEQSGVRVDVLADCGRISPGTPWPLIASAGLVLLVTRPTLRGVHHARHAAAAIAAEIGDARRVRLLVCGPGPYEAGEVARTVGVGVQVTLPADVPAAHAVSDGLVGSVGSGGSRGWSRTALARAAEAGARSVASAATVQAPAPAGVPTDSRWGQSWPEPTDTGFTGAGSTGTQSTRSELSGPELNGFRSTGRLGAGGGPR